jgi:hypothetical protein
LDFRSAFLEFLNRHSSEGKHLTLWSVRHGLTKEKDKKVYSREGGNKDVNWFHLAENITRKTVVVQTVVSITSSRWFLIQLHGFSEFGKKVIRNS